MPLTGFARRGSGWPADALTADQYQACLDRLEQDVDRFVLRDLTLDLCRSSVVPAVMTPRSLALAHLRTALWFHGDDPVDRFVTTDVSQRIAVKELGLPV